MRSTLVTPRGYCYEQFPAPSQCLPEPQLVPDDTYVIPHALLMHVRAWHALSVPVHCSGPIHSTQPPVLSQYMPFPQAVPALPGGTDGAPFLDPRAGQPPFTARRGLSLEVKKKPP